MSANAGTDAFVGYAGFIVLAAIIGFPAMGFGGVISAVVMIYFGLALVNGAGTAAKRQGRRNRR